MPLGVSHCPGSRRKIITLRENQGAVACAFHCFRQSSDRASRIVREGRGVKVLIIEDEAKTASFLAKGFAEAGFTVDAASRSDDGLHLARTGGYDLVVLDVMLPALDGWGVIKFFREQGGQTPVSFLTA